MKKGITPVVATVLLMTITIGAVGTLYGIVQGDLQRQTENTDGTDITLNTQGLRLESCYLNADSTSIVMRNNAREAVNASGYTVLINGKIVTSTTNKEVVNPQQTFTTEINRKIGGSQDIILTNGENDASFNCANLPDGKQLRLISIGQDARQSEGGTAPIPPDGNSNSYGGIYNGYNDQPIETESEDGEVGYSVALINRTNRTIVHDESYDIADSTQKQNFNNSLDTWNSSYNTEEMVVTIATSEEPENNRLSDGLEENMYAMGASENIYGSSSFKTGSAYALVGSPGLSKGEAYLELYEGDTDNDQDAWIDTTYEIETS